MPGQPRPSIITRKEPRQARSNDLVAAILQAAVQVLTTEGAGRFTTARVAEKAGVSIGSLYQYFPNKAAILFRLQSDEWQETMALLRSIVEDERSPPLRRLRTLVHAFLRSECEEAAIRQALDDAAPLYRDAPEARAAKAAGEVAFRRFVGTMLPDLPEPARMLACDLVKTTLGQVCKQVSEQERSEGEIDAYADALADMLCAYLERLGAAA